MRYFKYSIMIVWMLNLGVCGVLFTPLIFPQIAYADGRINFAGGAAKNVDIDTYRACKSLNACLDILERHAADSFDYNVLANDFYYLGPQGRAALIDAILQFENQNKKLSIRALNVLSRRNFSLTQREQTLLLAQWPKKSPRLMSKMFQTNITEQFAQGAILTLSHPSAVVRTASRDIIARAVRANIVIELDGPSETRVSQALRQDPHASLVKLLSKGPKGSVFQKLAPVLGFGDFDSVFAAYTELHIADPKGAFQALVTSLRRLKDTDIQPAMALSKLLQARHRVRKDGFYMRFAARVSSDKNMSMMGRVAGMDAHIIARKTDKKITPLKNTPLLYETYKTRLSLPQDIDPAYIDFAFAMENGSDKGWVSLMNDHFRRTEAPEYGVFIAKLGALKTPDAKRIVAEALRQTDNYILLADAISASQQQGENTAFLAHLAQIHPWTDIRIMANAALNPVKQSGSSKLARRKENKNAVYCHAKFIDPQEGAHQMPYFENPVLENGQTASRSALKTAASVKEGWLAGYSAGNFKGHALGGLFAFEYATGEAHKILSRNISAIFPIREMPLGEYETAFWVFTDALILKREQQSIYRVSYQDGKAESRHILTYPAKVKQFARNSKGNLYLGFVPIQAPHQGQLIDMRNYNPPLILSANGTIHRACNTNTAGQTLPSPVIRQSLGGVR